MQFFKVIHLISVIIYFSNKEFQIKESVLVVLNDL